MYEEDEFLQLSGIQHFAFCRRQWALIHVEQQWQENVRTVEGGLLHEKVHDVSSAEKRGDLVITRAMPIHLRELGISGECDLVEFHRCEDGIGLAGREGRFRAVPVEYKRGSPKKDDVDALQLTAQALCLEEMLCCEIPYGYLYYGETRHRLFLAASLKRIRQCGDAENLLGLEGEAASVYFSVFDDLILQQKEDFAFHGRNRRPPLDEVNAMLSFAYSLLAGMCGSALEAVGLDPYVGFYHRDRPGRMSLALDLMEELRSVMADRFVLTMINKRLIGKDGFWKKEDGAVIMDDDTRKKFLSAWQEKKQETIRHPFLDEKIEWGIVPHVQAMLLARYIRGDLDEYPPFLWK